MVLKLLVTALFNDSISRCGYKASVAKELLNIGNGRKETDKVKPKYSGKNWSQ
jgi:hypothetical protein